MRRARCSSTPATSRSTRASSAFRAAATPSRFSRRCAAAANDCRSREPMNAPVNPAPCQPGYSRAQFGDLQPDGTPAGGGDVSLDLILDVNVSVALEVGRTKITVRELLQLTQGSILELDRLAGEPLDVLVNGVRVARGEVVVVNDKFGIRLIEVVSPSERLE